MGKHPVIICENALEKAAARLPSKNQIAKALNLSYTTLKKHCREKPELAAAYERGSGKFLENSKAQLKRDLLEDSQSADWMKDKPFDDYSHPVWIRELLLKIKIELQYQDVYKEPSPHRKAIDKTIESILGKKV